MVAALSFKSFLVLLSALALSLDGVHADLLVVLLESSQVLTSLGKLTLLHTLSNVPVDEGSFGVHQVKLVIKTSPGLGNGRGVGQHADSTLNLRQVTTGNDGRGLVVDSDLETSWTPVDKLDGSEIGSNELVVMYVLGYDR